MYTIYILRNKDKTFHYVGMTNDLTRRLKEHFSGFSTTTKRYLPLELVYSELCEDRKTARAREKYFKSGTGREYRKSLLVE
jgi:putative endonuclease